MNWSILIPVGIAALALIVFLIWRNRKDQAQFEEQLKNNYPKIKDEEGDTVIDETMK